MSEFGHEAMRGKLYGKPVFIDSWGAGPFILTAGGKVYYFEDSDRFGPIPLDAKGNPRNDPFYYDEKSPFWRVWERWKAEGRKTMEGRKPGFLYCVVSNGRKVKGNAQGKQG